jgi:hypothetical protein
MEKYFHKVLENGSRISLEAPSIKATEAFMPRARIDTK